MAYEREIPLVHLVGVHPLDMPRALLRVVGRDGRDELEDVHPLRERGEGDLRTLKAG